MFSLKYFQKARIFYLPMPAGNNISFKYSDPTEIGTFLCPFFLN